MTEPVPFEVYEEGVYLHGTKAMLAPGELLLPAQPSNYRAEAPLRHLYLTETLHAAAWGAQLARGDGEPRIYVVEPTGELEDDPNVTDKKFPGNPTRSYRSTEPLKVIREVDGWPRMSPDELKTWRDKLAALLDDDSAEIIN